MVFISSFFISMVIHIKKKEEKLTKQDPIKAGISYYTYVVRANEDACKKCKALDGKEVTGDEIPIPHHPNCKCRLEAIENDEDKEDKEDKEEDREEDIKDILYFESDKEKKSEKEKQRRKEELLDILGDKATPADILLRTPEELEKRIEEEGLGRRNGKFTGGASAVEDTNSSRIPLPGNKTQEQNLPKVKLKDKIYPAELSVSAKFPAGFNETTGEMPAVSLISSSDTENTSQNNTYFSDDAIKRARNFIHGSEGFRDTAYKPTKDDVWTIGYGHTKNVKPGDKITREQAEEFYKQDFKEHSSYLKYVKVPLNDNEKIALTSLIYNIGPGYFMSSTLLKKLNAGDKKGAADEFEKWNKQNHKVLDGLTKRRQKEKSLFLTPD